MDTPDLGRNRARAALLLETVIGVARVMFDHGQADASVARIEAQRCRRVVFPFDRAEHASAKVTGLGVSHRSGGKIGTAVPDPATTMNSAIRGALEVMMTQCRVLQLKPPLTTVRDLPRAPLGLEDLWTLHLPCLYRRYFEILG